MLERYCTARAPTCSSVTLLRLSPTSSECLEALRYWQVQVCVRVCRVLVCVGGGLCVCVCVCGWVCSAEMLAGASVQVYTITVRPHTLVF